MADGLFALMVLPLTIYMGTEEVPCEIAEREIKLVL